MRKGTATDAHLFSRFELPGTNAPDLPSVGRAVSETTWKPTYDELLRALENLVLDVDMALTCEGNSHITDALGRRDVKRSLKNAKAHIEAGRKP